MTGEFLVRPVGWVESPLTELEEAPRQGDEGAPEAWLVLEPRISAAAADLREGEQVELLTWLHRADRDALQVHPRSDTERPLQGVFSTRSPDRPNPIGLHRVRIVSIEGNRVKVRHLEAVNGTPILDIKPVLGPLQQR